MATRGWTSSRHSCKRSPGRRRGHIPCHVVGSSTNADQRRGRPPCLPSSASHAKPATQERRPDDENAVAVIWVTARTVASAKVREISRRPGAQLARGRRLQLAGRAGCGDAPLGPGVSGHAPRREPARLLLLQPRIGLGYEHNPMDARPLPVRGNRSVFRIFGDGDYTARLFYALAGTVLVALPVLFRSRLGRRARLSWRRCWPSPPPCSTSAGSPATTSSSPYGPWDW